MTRTFLTILLQLMLGSNILWAQTPKEAVLFASDQYELTETATKLLDEQYNQVSKQLLYHITLTGHTDADGSPAYNLALSQKRAAAVRDYLLDKGIGSDKINIRASGEERPVASNAHEQQKQQNRRVEVLIEYMSADLRDLFKTHSKQPQFFKVQAGENIDIRGNEGTIVKIPKAALIKSNGQNAEGRIEIELKEFYTKADMLMADLHTMSGNEILESAGMIYISATASGEKLNLKKGIKISIEFASEKNPEMETFIGETQNNQLNWKPQNQKRNDDMTNFLGDPTAPESIVVADVVRDSVIKVSGADRMILEAVQLGWINCDRFVKYTDRTDLIVAIDSAYPSDARLVFTAIKAIMPGERTHDKKIIFKGIPVGQKATLIAFSLVDDEPYFVSREIQISKDQTESMVPLKTTLTALHSDLRKLNSSE